MCELISLTTEQSSTHLTVTHQFMIWLNIATFLLFLSLFSVTPNGKTVWIQEEAQELITSIVNGSLVKSTTFVLIPIAHSSAEAEYNACAFALADAIYVKQVWNFMNGRHLDTPITFALFTDSKSAIAMIE